MSGLGGGVGAELRGVSSLRGVEQPATQPKPNNHLSSNRRRPAPHTHRGVGVPNVRHVIDAVQVPPALGVKHKGALAAGEVQRAVVEQRRVWAVDAPAGLDQRRRVGGGGRLLRLAFGGGTARAAARGMDAERAGGETGKVPPATARRVLRGVELCAHVKNCAATHLYHVDMQGVNGGCNGLRNLGERCERCLPGKTVLLTEWYSRI